MKTKSTTNADEAHEHVEYVRQIGCRHVAASATADGFELHVCADCVFGPRVEPATEPSASPVLAAA